MDDYDQSDNDDDDSEAESVDSNAGRAHYEKVGKSKLRKPDEVSLGPQYAGHKVGREALQDDDSDEFPEGDFEDSGEEEGVVLNGRDVESSEENSEEEASNSSDEADEDDSASDMEVDDEDATSAPSTQRDAFDTAKLKALMNAEAKTVAASVGAAAKADVDKGLAVKAQRRTAERILQTRLGLQKSLISINLATVSAQSTPPSKTDHSVIEAAETAALALFNNLNTLLSQTANERTGTKRKRAPSFTSSTPSSQIWKTLRTDTSTHLPTHTATLDKWADKSRPATLAAPRRLAASQAPQSLSSVLASQLSDPARLIARTHTPRSCAPGLASPSAHIYDDGDFYGLLLKEFLEQRRADQYTPLATSARDDGGLGAQYKAIREAKTKRVVDTRASKGRKLKYTVHEKLQNFMAPEERNEWSERQADELFGSLLGRRALLDEAVAAEEEEGEDEVEGLRLF